MEVLFKTIHGSHLYGLSHADSDVDYYTVVDKVRTNKKRYAKQSIVDGVDSTVVDLGTWLQFCNNGVPQALEAMFSTAAETDKIGALRAGYRATTQAHDRYLRTIKSFAMQDDFKHKRHALRLAMNLRVMAARGRFNPRLTKLQVAAVNRWAEYEAELVYRMALDIAWGRVVR